MTNPIPVWFEAETIFARLPSGEIITFPAREPALLVSFLRRAAGITQTERNARREWELAAAKRGQEIRAAEEARAARERQRLLRKDEKYMAKKDAEKLLELVGL